MTETNSPLKAFIERVERVEETKREAMEDIAEIYQEAKLSGLDPKIMRKIVAVRRKKAAAVKEESEIFALYAEQLGMQTTFGF